MAMFSAQDQTLLHAVAERPANDGASTAVRPLVVRPALGRVLLREIQTNVDGGVALGFALELPATDDLDAVLAQLDRF